MLNLTLKQKFMCGMVAVVVVPMIILWSNRILGKGAHFHYLERDHLNLVTKLEAAQSVGRENPGHAALIGRDSLPRNLDGALAIAEHANTEFYATEELAFRLAGFGDVFDLPRKNIGDLRRVRAAIVATPGVGMTPQLELAMRRGMVVVRENTDQFGPAVARAVAFAQTLASVLTVACFGILAGLFIQLRNSTLGPIDEALGFAKRVAEGDLSGRIRVRSRDEFGGLFAALNDMNDKLGRIVGQVRQGADVIAHTSREFAAGNADLSMRTELQAGSLEETSSTMEQLCATVKQNAAGAARASALAATATRLATGGGLVVASVVATMGDIKASSNKIVDIIAAIDGIAFQTNILALNAAVEAARAGEQGRGFAVVAAEVRALAQRSAIAAKEIKGLIGDSVDSVAVGGALVAEAGRAMEGIVVSVERVARIVTHIASSAREQGEGIAQVEQSIRAIDDMTQQNAALVEQAAAAAYSMSDHASRLAHGVKAFSLVMPERR